MGLEKPVISGGNNVELPFNYVEKGIVETSSYFTFDAYKNTNVEPLALSVDFTASKNKFYMVKESNFIAFGSTVNTDSDTVYFHVKNLTDSKISVTLANCKVYECEY